MVGVYNHRNTIYGRNYANEMRGSNSSVYGSRLISIVFDSLAHISSMLTGASLSLTWPAKNTASVCEISRMIGACLFLAASKAAMIAGEEATF